MRFLLAGLLAYLLLPLGPVQAQNVDLNIITAIDTSGSVHVAEDRLQYEGLARGVEDPEFLRLLSRGRNAAVGFMVITWGSGGQERVVVPWMLLRGPEDAAQAAQALLAALDSLPDSGMPGLARNPSGMTNTVSALNFAIDASLNAPYLAERTAINLLTDGESNEGPHPSVTRNRALSLGFAISAVLFGEAGDKKDYFLQYVATPELGGFIEYVESPDEIVPTLERKFLRDMASLAFREGG